MLLNLYLGSTAVSWAILGVYTVALNQRLKRKGYEEVKEEKKVFEVIVDNLSTIFIGCIPVFNIVNSMCMLCSGEKALDYYEKLLLEKGLIRKIETKENDDKLKEEITENIETKEKAKDLSNDREYEEYHSYNYSNVATNNQVKKRGLRKTTRRKKQ